MLPIELKEFFKKRGRILLIKGNAGTGKTLLGFRLLKEMQEHGEVIWVNSRDMDSADISELEEIVPNDKRFDATIRERSNEIFINNEVDAKKESKTIAAYGTCIRSYSRNGIGYYQQHH